VDINDRKCGKLVREETRISGVWWGKGEVKRSLGRPRLRWENELLLTFRLHITI
jgi:hypothetical protein